MLALIFTKFMTSARYLTTPLLDWLNQHKMRIQQGNYVTDTDIAKLYPNLNHLRALFLLLPPVLTAPVHTNCWNYINRDIKRRELYKNNNRLLTLSFNGDTLERIGKPKNSTESSSSLTTSTIYQDVQP
jgi:outer membrane protein assembly factor BamE (lipoprotein component of BamABCDE complex)